MSRDVVTLEVGQAIEDAIGLFARREFRHIPVVADGRLCGVISDRDVLRAMARSQDVAAPVSTIMRTDPLHVGPETPIDQAIATLIAHRINCLPVVTGTRTLAGILTTTDLLRALLALQVAAAPAAGDAPA